MAAPQHVESSRGHCPRVQLRVVFDGQDLTFPQDAVIWSRWRPDDCWGSHTFDGKLRAHGSLVPCHTDGTFHILFYVVAQKLTSLAVHSRPRRNSDLPGCAGHSDVIKWHRWAEADGKLSHGGTWRFSVDCEP